MLMTLLGRECPDLPAEVLFSDPEIEVLQAYAKKKESANQLGSGCRPSCRGRLRKRIAKYAKAVSGSC